MRVNVYLIFETNMEEKIGRLFMCFDVALHKWLLAMRF